MSNYRDYTFSRNDTMLIQRPSGTWERVAANFPALTYKDDDYGKYRAGAWIPKALTNLFRNSEPASDPGQGSRVAVTFLACDWALGLANALDGMVVFGDNSIQRYYYNTDALATSTLHTFGFIIKPDDGLLPSFGGASASNIARVDIGNTPVSSGYTVQAISNGLYFVQVQATSFTSNTANTGIFKLTGHNAIGFEASAILCHQGNIVWNSWQDFLIDYIRTTGSSVARANTDIRNTSFPLLDNVQGYIDVEVNPLTTSNQRIVCIGLDDNNLIRNTKTSTNVIDTAYIVSGVLQWSLNSSASYGSGRFRIAFYYSNGLNIFYIDGVEIGRNTNSYTPQGANFVLGRQISGTPNQLINGGFFGQFMTSGLSEEQLIEKFSFKNITEWAAFKRATFDDQALTLSAITLLQNTEL